MEKQKNKKIMAILMASTFSLTSAIHATEVAHSDPVAEQNLRNQLISNTLNDYDKNNALQTNKERKIQKNMVDQNKTTKKLANRVKNREDSAESSKTKLGKWMKTGWKNIAQKRMSNSMKDEKALSEQLSSQESADKAHMANYLQKMTKNAKTKEQYDQIIDKNIKKNGILSQQLVDEANKINRRNDIGKYSIIGGVTIAALLMNPTSAASKTKLLSYSDDLAKAAETQATNTMNALKEKLSPDAIKAFKNSLKTATPEEKIILSKTLTNIESEPQTYSVFLKGSSTNAEALTQTLKTQMAHELDSATQFIANNGKDLSEEAKIALTSTYLDNPQNAQNAIASYKNRNLLPNVAEGQSVNLRSLSPQLDDSAHLNSFPQDLPSYKLDQTKELAGNSINISDNVPNSLPVTTQPSFLNKAKDAVTTTAQKVYNGVADSAVILSDKVKQIMGRIQTMYKTEFETMTNQIKNDKELIQILKSQANDLKTIDPSKAESFMKNAWTRSKASIGNTLDKIDDVQDKTVAQLYAMIRAAGLEDAAAMTVTETIMGIPKAAAYTVAGTVLVNQGVNYVAKKTQEENAKTQETLAQLAQAQQPSTAPAA